MSFIIQPVTNSKVNAALDTDYTVDSSFTISLVFGGTVNLGTGATTQDVWAKLNTNNATLASYVGVTTAAETLSSAVTFKLTGEAVSNNDVVQENLLV
jgi:ribose 5-phosphate isomerase